MLITLFAYIIKFQTREFTMRKQPRFTVHRCLPNCSETQLYGAVLHALSNDVQQTWAQSH